MRRIVQTALAVEVAIALAMASHLSVAKSQPPAELKVTRTLVCTDATCIDDNGIEVKSDLGAGPWTQYAVVVRRQ